MASGWLLYNFIYSYSNVSWCFPASLARFWPAFAERVSRLVASQSLDGPTMARARTQGPESHWANAVEDTDSQMQYSSVNSVRLCRLWSYYETLNRMFTAEQWIQKFAEVFAACSQWKQKCHEDVNWGHMIRDLVDLLKLWNIGSSRVVLPMYLMAPPVVNALSIFGPSSLPLSFTFSAFLFVSFLFFSHVRWMDMIWDDPFCCLVFCVECTIVYIQYIYIYMLYNI